MCGVFCAGRETYSTGVIAISTPCTDPAYGTVCSVGIYNSPWQGDLYNHDAAAADFVSFCRQHKAAYDADPDKPRDGEGKWTAPRGIRTETLVAR